MATTDLSLRLMLAPDADDRRIAGRLRDERGDEHSFSSWVGLLSLLDEAHTRARREPRCAAAREEGSR